jgi:CHAT domain-containing protein/tetratricopeptide (TPR) repeat protein
MQGTNALGCVLCILLVLPQVGEKAERLSFSLIRDAYPNSLKLGTRFFQNREYLRAAKVFDEGYRASLRRRDFRFAARFLRNVGTCNLEMYQYLLAMRAYSKALDICRRTSDNELAATIALNLSSVYTKMGDYEAAYQAALRGFSEKRKPASSENSAKFLIHLATLTARKGDAGEARRLFRRGIQEAERCGKPLLQATGLDQFGAELLRAGEVEDAKDPILKAFELRSRERAEDIQFSYINLGMLHLAQGSPKTASKFLDKAIDLVEERPQLFSGLPLCTIYHKRGQARMMGGEVEGALADFQTAIDLARTWRLSVLPADSFRATSGSELQQIYSSFIEAANRLYFKSKRKELAWKTFQMAEENRATSLCASLYSSPDWWEKLPTEYWELLGQLRNAETALLRGGSRGISERVDRLRLELKEAEVRAGLDSAWQDEQAEPFKELTHLQAALGPEQAYLGFHIGAERSYLWSVTGQRFELYKLGARAEISAARDEFIAAIRSGSGDVASRGETLYRELFGGLAEHFREKQEWLLALDDVLFTVPFSALIVRRAGKEPTFLVEQHAVRIVPAAFVLSLAASKRVLDHRGVRRREDHFVGVGDPIYNTADPRWASPSKPHLFGLLSVLKAKCADGNPLQLPRLAGSASEITSCAKAWATEGKPTVILTGREASKVRLTEAMKDGASVLHFATHFVRSPRPPSASLVALSLAKDGMPELLSYDEIRSGICSKGLNLGLVVLSGCSSGAAEALPGEGLMGLARAWVAAGAENVAASHWSTPDDTGALFLCFYRYLREFASAGANGSTARALQRAQLSMLHSGTWRAQPNYWAAYFIFGKE